MFDFIETANKVRAVHPEAEILMIFIVAPTYTACDRLRSKFPPGIGNILYAQNMAIEFVATQHLDEFFRVRGHTAICCVTDDVGKIPNDLLHSIHISLTTSALALGVTTDRLIVEL